MPCQTALSRVLHSSTGTFHEFDARVGGGYRMSLFYPPDERRFRGKTAEREDRVAVRFLELTPPRRIVEAVTFVTTDPSLMGEMTMTATFDQVAGGTEVTLAFDNLPPGLRLYTSTDVVGYANVRRVKELTFDAVLRLIPWARVGHIGLRRDETTAVASRWRLASAGRSISPPARRRCAA